MSQTLPSQRAHEKEKKLQFGWIEKTISGIAGTIEQAVFTEEHARKNGWLQRRDPRAKLGMFLVTVLAASLSNSFFALAALYILVLLAAKLSQVPFDFFVKRVWLGIPFFAGVVIIPSIFFTSIVVTLVYQSDGNVGRNLFDS